MRLYSSREKHHCFKVKTERGIVIVGAPATVRTIEEQVSNFVTQLCAVVGGFYTVTRLVDDCIFTTSDAIRRRIGKHS